MIYNIVGYYSLILGLIIGLSLFYFSYKNFNNSNVLDTKILSFTFLQLFFVVISFLSLIFSFVISDFSNVTVFNNSHTKNHYFIKFQVYGGIMKVVYSMVFVLVYLFFYLY